MRRIKNESLAELLMQLRFTPEKKRRKELDAAEALFKIVKKEKEYPFGFVVFRITGYSPKTPDADELIAGEDLLADLRVFISKLGSPLAQPAAEAGEKVYTLDELAGEMGVSKKTVRRWQDRGLIGRRYLFGDGVKRLGFARSSVEAFLESNRGLVERARDFRLMSSSERDAIIREAGKLAAGTDMSRYQIIERISSATGRAHETIRTRLLEYEKAHPERPVSRPSHGVISPAQAGEIYRLFCQGTASRELMKRFNRSKSTIYRVINRGRAKSLLKRKIEFIGSDEFMRGDSEGVILAKPLEEILPAEHESIESFNPDSASLPRYLQTLKRTPVLNRERELELFRRYNYLKYLACLQRAGMKPSQVSSKRLCLIEQYLGEAEQIKGTIIEANLRLVVGIARKHTISGANLPDLISEGNLSLMRAVEKFDYTRGFRFSTYASWSIAKDYARRIPAEAARRDKAAAASLARIQQDLKDQGAADFAAMEKARQSLAQVIRNELDEREQYVILNRFGPVGQPIKRKTKTLKQIGADLALTRERVRQVELTALQKLRQSLSPEEFELLTG